MNQELKLMLQPKNEQVFDLLIGPLFEAHRNAAINNGSISSAIFQSAKRGSWSTLQAICSAMLSIGGAHGTVTAARELLKAFHVGMGPNILIYKLREAEMKVPGFGHSIYKDRIDPAFLAVYDSLSEATLRKIIKLRRATETIFEKDLYPNAAIITAACAEEMELPENGELLLFMLPRISAWVNHL